MNSCPIDIHLELNLDCSVQPSPNVRRVAGMFGLGLDHQRQRSVIPPAKLTLIGGQIVFITGPSGSGKSSILRLIQAALRRHPTACMVHLNNLPQLPDQPLVDCFDGVPLPQLLQYFSVAGLNDAFVMLRRPSQLSDGQLYRLQLVQAITHLQTLPSDVPCIVLADEFAATLDRVTAHVLARNLRKWVNQSVRQSVASPANTPSSPCVVVATSHDDLLEPLDPDLLIEKQLGGGMRVMTRTDACTGHQAPPTAQTTFHKPAVVAESPA